MQLDITLVTGESVEGMVVRTIDGRLELRPLDAPEIEPLEPSTSFKYFTLPSVIVVADELGRDVSVEVKKGQALESLLPSQCVVPGSWPRGIEVAARCYIGPTGWLVLDEPRCFACTGSGKSPISPPGWIGAFGAHCEVCGGSGEYVVKTAPTGDDKEVVS